MKKKISLSNFKKLTDNSTGEFVGGFSHSLSAGNAGPLKKNDVCPKTNNCNGGNCVEGCASR